MWEREKLAPTPHHLSAVQFDRNPRFAEVGLSPLVDQRCLYLPSYPQSARHGYSRCAYGVATWTQKPAPLCVQVQSLRETMDRCLNLYAKRGGLLCPCCNAVCAS